MGTRNTTFLERFFRESGDLIHALKTDYDFNELDRLRLENHFAVMQIAYVEWKQRNSSPTYFSAPMREHPSEGGQHNSRQSTKT